MDKRELQNIFNSSFSIESWKEVLIQVFGVKQLNIQPQSIELPPNDKADDAFELGIMSTADDRIIGLYQVNVKPTVWIEKNKVGLRELLKSIYRDVVDGALIVFVQQDKWRLSFVSEIRAFDEDGNISKKVTEPKRYTYLLGQSEKVKTAVNRIFSLSFKPIALEDIREAFSVEALNEEFYNIVAEHFYHLVGAEAGKGKKHFQYQKQLVLPDGANDNIYREFSVRLIGRIIFCWFLKVKKSDDGVALLPEQLLSSTAAKSNQEYYHTILENLFFQMLNTPMDRRQEGLPSGSELIPFLNGGLFEPHADDFYTLDAESKISSNYDTLKIPDSWFLSFFDKLEQYNFTIDENSVVDIEVSVDPEMLGRIFENLLAEINPISGDTARKATGSYYTPREIVDYMATESLIYYLKNDTGIDRETLEPIFRIDSNIELEQNAIERILNSLDRVKILDPACGSGAFPIGVMQKIVIALQKLDADAILWKEKQINRIENVVLKRQVKEKLDTASIEYARKIGIIQNSLYGVDIQSIAIEISKLRCFLTLIVDETIDEEKPNRGIEPLPNLEFKFVAADALQKLPEEPDFGGLFNANDELEKLQSIRLEYLQSYGEDKVALKRKFKDVQDEIAQQQTSLAISNTQTKSRATLISEWEPFTNDKVDWFDSLWMFGIKEFDIVIGNPPYGIRYSKQQILDFKKYYDTIVGHTEAYYLFIEGAFKYQKENGVLTYIVPNSWLSNKYAKGIRNLLINQKQLHTLINLNKHHIFKNAGVENSVFISTNQSTTNHDSVRVGNSIDFDKTFKANLLNWRSSTDFLINFSENPTVEYLLSHIKSAGISLNEVLDISNGFKPYQVGYGKNLLGHPLTKNDVANKIYHSSSKIDNHYKKQVKGKNIKRYSINWTEGYIKWGNWLMSPKDSRYFESPKILIRQIIGDRLIGCFDKDKYYADQSLYALINYSQTETALKFYLAIINSKVLGFYFRSFYSENDDLFPKIKVNELKKLPVPDHRKLNITPLEILVDYLIFLNKASITVQAHSSNSHLIRVFEEIIDAIVFELYFEEDFKHEGIEFLKYAERDFKSIVGKSEEEAVTIINATYQKLREKDNEIRNNLLLMDIKLAHIVMPIKTST